MPTSEGSTHVDAAPSDLFALLDDGDKAPLWMESCSALVQVSPGVKNVGTQLHYSYAQGGRPGMMDGTVIEYEKDRRLATHFFDEYFAVDVEFDLAPDSNGTSLTHRITITPLTLMNRLLAPVIQVGNKRQVANNLRRVKALAERGAAGRPA